MAVIHVSMTHHARQNEGVTGTLEDHDLQTSTSESCICNQAQHEKGPFQWLEN